MRDENEDQLNRLLGSLGMSALNKLHELYVLELDIFEPCPMEKYDAQTK